MSSSLIYARGRRCAEYGIGAGGVAVVWRAVGVVGRLRRVRYCVLACGAWWLGYPKIEFLPKKDELKTGVILATPDDCNSNLKYDNSKLATETQLEKSQLCLKKFSLKCDFWQKRITRQSMHQQTRQQTRLPTHQANKKTTGFAGSFEVSM